MLVELMTALVDGSYQLARAPRRRAAGVGRDLEVRQFRVALDVGGEVVRAARVHVEALDLRLQVGPVLGLPAAEAVARWFDRRARAGQRLVGARRAAGRRVHRAHVAELARTRAEGRVAEPLVRPGP